MLMGIVTTGFANNVWSGFKDIAQVETTENSGFLVQFDSQIAVECTPAMNSGVELYIYPNQNAVTADGAKGLLATVLTAYSLGKLVEVLYDNSDPHCWGRYVDMK
jgi:hypothetical protein